MKFIDLTGKKFNRLTVIRRAEDKDKHAAWLCKCDCGNETVVLGKYLKNGKIKSCGCFRKEYLKEKMNEMNKSLGKETHGQTVIIALIIADGQLILNRQETKRKTSK